MPPKKTVVKDLPEPAKESEVIEIPFRDGVITVPRDKGKWPTRAVLALQRGDNLAGIEIAVGEEQWNAVTDSQMGEFNDFVKAFADEARKLFSA